MNISIEDKAINDIVNKLDYGVSTRFTENMLSQDVDVDKIHLTTVFNIAKGKGLITQETKNFISLTIKGLEIKDNGGWIEEIKSIHLKKQNQEKRQLTQDQINELDLKIKSLEHKVGSKIKITIFIVTLLNFLITVLTLQIWKGHERKNEKETQVKPLLEMQGNTIKKDSLN